MYQWIGNNKISALTTDIVNQGEVKTRLTEYTFILYNKLLYIIDSRRQQDLYKSVYQAGQIVANRLTKVGKVD